MEPENGTVHFGARNKTHILDLQQTMPMFHQALQALSDVTSRGGRVLFVGTKRAAAEKIAETARNCGQYYVNHRWLGGMLTNWSTVSQSIRRLRDLEARFESGEINQLTKKETSNVLDGLMATIGQAGFAGEKVSQATMVNAVTAVSHMSDIDNRSDWQRRGSQVLDMSPSDWQRVAC